MWWLIELVISLFTASWSPSRRVDRSIVEKSRMDEQGERLGVACALVLIVGFIAFKIARAKGWL